jgi:uncharacterized membrane protein
MKKHYEIVHPFVFALAITLCMPAQAMLPALRQAGQKVSTATAKTLTFTACQARFGEATLAKAGKNLQKTIVVTRGATRGVQTAARHLMPHWQTITAQKTAAAAQPLKIKALHTAQQIIGGVTAIGTGAGAAYGIDYVKTDPQIRQLHKELTIEYLNNNSYHLSTLIEKHVDNPLALSVIIKFVTYNITKLNSNAISTLLCSTQPIQERMQKLFLQEKPRLKKILLETSEKKDRVAFLEMAFKYACFFGNEFETIFANSNLTITERHVLHFLGKNRFLFFSALANSDPTGRKLLASFINTIIKLEREAVQKNMFTFVHGQRWHHLLPEKMFTDLWGLHHGKQVKNFIFAHVRNRDSETKEKEFYENLTGEHSEREHSKRLLFLNCPLFGNVGSPSESSYDYFSNNTNIDNKKIPSIRQVFELHGDSETYKQHEKELNDLEQEFDSLGNGHGNLLFFALPKKLAKDYVYVAWIYGFKKTIKINNKDTDDLDIVMDAYQKHPETLPEDDYNKNQFCLIMVKEAMNPESGIKVKAFNTADPDKMAIFWKKYDAVMAKIKADIEAKQPGLPQDNDTSIFERYQELFI